MTEYNKILITSLKNYLNGKDERIDFDTETAEMLVKQSREQKVLPIVFYENAEALQNVLPQKAFLKIKSEVMFSVSSQLQRDVELVRICRLFETNELKYIIFKGAVCRALYDNSEYRVSSDEDIFVGESQLSSAVNLLCESGYSVVEENDGEVKLINKSLNSLVEIHSSLVDRTYSDGMDFIGNLFEDQLDNPYIMNTAFGEIKTFLPAFGFLSLCIHFFNHFVRGGIGIRPVMDIACFLKKYSDEIDFEYFFSVLDTIKARKTIHTVISLCVEYFEIESGYADGFSEVERLLNDILSAGAYGTADAGRVHSGTATKGAVYGKGGIISAVIPSEKDIVRNFPEMEGQRKEINRYRLRRIKKRIENGENFKIITTVSKRKKLMKKLGLIDRKRK